MVDLKLHEVTKLRLRLAGSSFSKIARKLCVAPSTVTSVSQGYRRSRRIEQAIACTLGEMPAQLWPDRYPTPLAEQPGVGSGHEDKTLNSPEHSGCVSTDRPIVGRRRLGKTPTSSATGR